MRTFRECEVYKNFSRCAEIYITHEQTPKEPFINYIHVLRVVATTPQPLCTVPTGTIMLEKSVRTKIADELTP